MAISPLQSYSAFVRDNYGGEKSTRAYNEYKKYRTAFVTAKNREVYGGSTATADETARLAAVEEARLTAEVSRQEILATYAANKAAMQEASAQESARKEAQRVAAVQAAEAAEAARHEEMAARYAQSVEAEPTPTWEEAAAASIAGFATAEEAKRQALLDQGYTEEHIDYLDTITSYKETYDTLLEAYSEPGKSISSGLTAPEVANRLGITEEQAIDIRVAEAVHNDMARDEREWSEEYQSNIDVVMASYISSRGETNIEFIPDSSTLNEYLGTSSDYLDSVGESQMGYTLWQGSTLGQLGTAISAVREGEYVSGTLGLLDVHGIDDPLARGIVVSGMTRLEEFVEDPLQASAEFIAETYISEYTASEFLEGTALLAAGAAPALGEPLRDAYEIYTTLDTVDSILNNPEQFITDAIATSVLASADIISPINTSGDLTDIAETARDPRAAILDEYVSSEISTGINVLGSDLTDDEADIAKLMLAAVASTGLGDTISDAVGNVGFGDTAGFDLDLPDLSYDLSLGDISLSAPEFSIDALQAIDFDFGTIDFDPIDFSLPTFIEEEGEAVIEESTPALEEEEEEEVVDEEEEALEGIDISLDKSAAFDREEEEDAFSLPYLKYAQQFKKQTAEQLQQASATPITSVGPYDYEQGQQGFIQKQQQNDRRGTTYGTTRSQQRSAGRRRS